MAYMTPKTITLGDYATKEEADFTALRLTNLLGFDCWTHRTFLDRILRRWRVMTLRSLLEIEA